MTREKSTFIPSLPIVTVTVFILAMGASQAMTQGTHKSTLTTLHNASGAALETIIENYREQHQTDVQELLSILAGQENTLKNRQKIEASSREWFAITLLSASTTLIQDSHQR